MIDRHLNFITQESYLTSLALLRQKIAKGRDDRNLPSALRLAVTLPHGHVELFIQTSNLYLIGFLGKGGKVFTVKLEGGRPEDAAEGTIRRSERLNPGEEIVNSRLRADHAALGTFSWDFGYSDLCECRSLFLCDTAEHCFQMRKSISLLACMICEGSRFLDVQNAFAGIEHISGEYWPRAVAGNGVWGGSVKADGVINYWKMATKARALSERYGVGVSQAHQYALQLDAAREKIESTLCSLGKPPNRKVAWNWLAGASGQNLSELQSALDKDLLVTVRTIVCRLRFADGDSLGEFVGALKSDEAVKAAVGLLMPAV